LIFEFRLELLPKGSEHDQELRVWVRGRERGRGRTEDPVAGAAMGGDDGELAAPGGDGFGDSVEQALIGVQGELVEGDVTAFASEGVWVGGKAIDAAAVRELQGESGMAIAGFAVEEDFAEVGGALVQDFGPVDAIFEGEFGLGEISGDDIGVEAGVDGADEQDQAEGVAEGEAGISPGF